MPGWDDPVTWGAFLYAPALIGLALGAGVGVWFWIQSWRYRRELKRGPLQRWVEGDVD